MASTEQIKMLCKKEWKCFYIWQKQLWGNFKYIPRSTQYWVNMFLYIFAKYFEINAELAWDQSMNSQYAIFQHRTLDIMKCIHGFVTNFYSPQQVGTRIKNWKLNISTFLNKPNFWIEQHWIQKRRLCNCNFSCTWKNLICIPFVIKHKHKI